MRPNMVFQMYRPRFNDMHNLWWMMAIILLGFQKAAGQLEMAKKETTSEVVVYGGTSAAVIAAVQLARMGKSVVIVSPDKHLGGLTASGLGYTDVGNKAVIGGLSREFYQRVYQYYQKPETWRWEKKAEFGSRGQGTPAIDGEHKTIWIFEPHIAENVYEDFIKEHGIKVFRDEWLDREKGVTKENGAIISMATLSGKLFSAKIFIDATYEGDLMEAAGVGYHVGREANSVYDEKWNGVQTGVLHHGHHFGKMQIIPYVDQNNPESGVLPKISVEFPGEKGSGDKKVQAYCFRTCLTKVEKNRAPFQRPPEYDPDDYLLILRVFEKGWNEVFHKFDEIPNKKTDVNNHGPFSFDNIGMSYDYPEGSYERRKEIIAEHESYQKGLLYFLANDLRVPDSIRIEMSKWGLAKDEFLDNGHWPHQIYVREARRMVGQYVMTENEILGRTNIEDPIGMGSYTMDSHNVQRYVTPEGHVQNEGDIGVHPENPYKIALGTVLPKKEECTNLIVPVAVSSSHIAFGSIRMEPVFMILGQSAATVAAMAITKNTSVQDVPYDSIRQRLLEDGQILELEPKDR